MKKDLYEILNILVRMSQGEDVVEHYNSEKTAKAVRNGILKYLKSNDFWNAYRDQSLSERERNMFNILNENGFLDLVLNNKDRFGLSPLKLIDVSIDQTSYDELNKDGAKYGFYYVDKWGHPTSKYTAYCDVETKTLRRSAIDEYNDLATRLSMLLKDWYGTYGFGYFPLKYVQARRSNREFTERILKSNVREMEAILSDPVGSGYLGEKPAPSEKQLYWIQKKLGINPNNLNKYQASELLDALFNGASNKANNDPSDVISYYRGLLGENKNRNMKRKIRISENAFNRIFRKLEEERKIKFTLDEISKITFNNDRCLVINESNNWILKRKNWEINNYQRFLDIVEKTPRKFKGYLTYHGMDEITDDSWITYTLKGHDVCFALHYLGPGQVDICNFVNNSDLRGIGDAVLQFAKAEGGTQMDNYRGFKSEEDPEGHGKLGNLYRKNGFDRQTWSAEFDPKFQPEDPEWQLDKSNFKDGKGPDVEGLELSRHRKKFNTAYRPYKDKWMKRVASKFGKN